MCALRGGSGELTQQRKLPLTDHALGVVGIGTENSADRAIVVRDRTVGEGVVCLFRIAIPLHDQKLGFDVGAFVASHRLREHRLDVLPNLAPDPRTGLPSAHGCLPPMMDLSGSL